MSVTISIKSVTTQVTEGGKIRLVLEAVRVGELAEAATVQIELTPIVLSDSTKQALIDAGFIVVDGKFISPPILFTTIPTTETVELTLTIPQDTIAEPDEQFDLRLVNPRFAEIGAGGPVRITIVDDDVGPLPIINIATATSVNEADGTAQISVTRSFPEGSDPPVFRSGLRRLHRRRNRCRLHMAIARRGGVPAPNFPISASGPPHRSPWWTTGL